MKLLIGDKEIKGDGPWPFHSFKTQAECDKATQGVDEMYALHHKNRDLHGSIWRNTDDGKTRIYDNNLLRWCTRDETNDPQLKQLLEPFHDM